jgi:hypothetical protein
VSAFCDKYNHTRDECGEKGQGTVIKTGNLKVLAIIDGDSLIGDQAKSADCIVLALHKKHRIVAIIELKSKVVYAEDVVRKIQETTNFLTGIMKELSFSPDKTSFYPIIFSKRIRSVESPQFLKPANRVTFLGKKYFVARKRYDVPLSDIIAVLST